MAAPRNVFECAYINAQICKAKHAYEIHTRTHTFIISQPDNRLLHPRQNIRWGQVGEIGDT